ncbi:hypothetical protein EI94DRAFT_500768 [Lactarius quietus]|nr:hypothetical protein EI94DRAFT_500768 [Lactarius quietus]
MSDLQVFSPLIAICAGIGVLLQAIKNVRSGQDAVVDMFGRIEHFFQRLVAYTGVKPTAAMTDVIIKIMVEVLLILGNVTNEVGQGRTRKIFKRLVGRSGVEDALQQLDKLTQEVARMAETEVQTIARRNDEMKEVDDRVEVVSSKVHDIAHSPQQSGTRPRHESPEGRAYGRRLTRDRVQSPLFTKLRLLVPRWVQALPSITPSSSRLTSAATPTARPVNENVCRPLTPTIQKVLPEDFKFRILVVGKSGSGKSSLIKAVFKADITVRIPLVICLT